MFDIFKTKTATEDRKTYSGICINGPLDGKQLVHDKVSYTMVEAQGNVADPDDKLAFVERGHYYHYGDALTLAGTPIPVWAWQDCVELHALASALEVKLTTPKKKR